MKNKKILTMSMILINLALVSTITAFGVASSYWDGFPLRIAPGATEIVDINLQNMMDTEDVTVRLKIISGSDIASLKKDTYVVKGRTSDLIAPLKIKIPGDAQVGETKRIHVDVETVVPSDAGMVSIGIGSGAAFNVIITGEIVKRKIPWTTINIILGIIILGIIILIIIRRKKRLVQEQKKLVENE